MKKAIYLPAALLLFVSIFTSCKDKLDDLVETCQTIESGCGEYQACANTSEAWYTYGGKTYNCDGLNCLTAAEEVVNDIADDCQ
ncbi:MAG: hypothetical protein OCD76_04970 [Reichenbachiella sp.]